MTRIILIAICVFLLILYKIVPWNYISELFKDNNGNFSNEVLWTAIGGIIAFLGVIITIICTEKSRIRQNNYDYIRNHKELELNVSADVIGFKPISLKELLKKVEEKK